MEASDGIDPLLRDTMDLEPLKDCNLPPCREVGNGKKRGPIPVRVVEALRRLQCGVRLADRHDAAAKRSMDVRSAVHQRQGQPFPGQAL